MEIMIKLKDGVFSYVFVEDGKIVLFEDLPRYKQVSLLNGLANGYNLFINVLKEE